MTGAEVAQHGRERITLWLGQGGSTQGFLTGAEVAQHGRERTTLWLSQGGSTRAATDLWSSPCTLKLARRTTLPRWAGGGGSGLASGEGGTHSLRMRRKSHHHAAKRASARSSAPTRGNLHPAVQDS